MTVQETARAVSDRVRVEFVSKDFRLLVAVAAGTALLRLAGNSSGGGIGVALLATGVLWPVLCPMCSGLIFARDRESGAREVALALGASQADVRRVAFGASAVCASFLVVVPAILGLLASVVSGGGFAGDLAVGLRCLLAFGATGPMLVVIGALAGEASGRRDGALGVAVVATVLFVAIERAAATVSVLRWVHLAGPLGLFDVMVNGSGSNSLPRRLAATAVVIAASFSLASLVALGLAVGRPMGARRRASGPRRYLLASAGSLVFGFVVPTAVGNVLPWQYSPTWILDEVTGRTPDVAFENLIRSHDRNEIRQVTGGGLVDRALLDARDLRVELDRHAPRAGTVVVSWVDGRGERRSVFACAIRDERAWVLRGFSNRGCS